MKNIAIKTLILFIALSGIINNVSAQATQGIIYQAATQVIRI